MKIGIPKEIKADEFRVALLPAGAQALVRDGHEVLIEASSGAGAGITDAEYEAAGAQLVPDAKALYGQAELIVKVKEPQPAEVALLRPDHVVFGYFHFAGSRSLTEDCLARGFTALAYETLEGPDGSLPLLVPMSEIAGRLSIQAGARHLEAPAGGSGVLLSGAPGVPPAHVVVVGGGIVGRNAALMAAGLGARVTVLDINLNSLRALDKELPANVATLYSDAHNIRSAVTDADLLITAVLVPGRAAPKLVTRDLLRHMRPKSVVVDVCIDQGGGLETSRPTTHSQPTFVAEGVVHYCVANMPAAVGRTSTRALCHATFPYLQRLASQGVQSFLATSPGHHKALNLAGGKLLNPDVRAAFPDLPS